MSSVRWTGSFLQFLWLVMKFQMLRCVYLQGEVHVTWGVNDVDQMLVPGASGSSRSDGDASLLLLSHPVHSGSPLMHLPNLVCLASVI